MTRGHIAFLLFVLLLAGWLFLRPKEQPLRIAAIPAQAQLCITAPPPMCKPQGDVDCARRNTREFA